MSRTEKIWKKDDYFSIVGKGRFDMDPAIVGLPDKTIPLMWGFDNNASPMGVVENIRFLNGEIIGDVIIKQNTQWEVIDGVSTGVESEEPRRSIHSMLDEGQIRLGGYYSHIIEKDGQVLNAKLQGVSLVLEPPFGANPGADIHG